MTHVTCRLTAKNRDQLRNPTLGNRVWTTFALFTLLYLTWYTGHVTVVEDTLDTEAVKATQSDRDTRYAHDSTV